MNNGKGVLLVLEGSSLQWRIWGWFTLWLFDWFTELFKKVTRASGHTMSKMSNKNKLPFSSTALLWLIWQANNVVSRTVKVCYWLCRLVYWAELRRTTSERNHVVCDRYLQLLEFIFYNISAALVLLDSVMKVTEGPSVNWSRGTNIS